MKIFEIGQTIDVMDSFYHSTFKARVVNFGYSDQFTKLILEKDGKYFLGSPDFIYNKLENSLDIQVHQKLVSADSLEELVERCTTINKFNVLGKDVA